MKDPSDGAVRLYLLRHADAAGPGAWSGPDAERPLSDEGRRQAEQLARHLAAIGFVADVIRSSPKARALETARIVAAAVGGQVVPDDRLAGGLGLGDVAAIVREASGASGILLVGHDPDLSALVGTLTGAYAPLRKGTLARIDLDVPVAERSGTLRWLLPPDAIPKD